MIKMKFSKSYDTYIEWRVDNPEDTPYNRRIIREHILHPDASLSQLRGHARKKEKPISQKRQVPKHKLSWQALSPKEKSQRKTALNVLSDVRNNGKSLYKACKEKGVTVKTVLKSTNAFKKVGNRWTAKEFDRISRIMKISEDDEETSIEINDSRTASLIGRYHNAVKKYLETGNTSELDKFKGKTIKDAQGNTHVFETDTEALDEIHESREDEEFYEIYSQ